MGISSFSQVIEYLSSVKSERGLSEFKGQIAIIDGSHRLLKQCIGRINNKTQLTNFEGKLTIHLYVTFVTIMGMLDYGIQPFFVFEGKCNSEDKIITCSERKRVKAIAQKRCEEIVDKSSPEYYKNLKKCFQLTSEHYKEVKYLLKLAGIPYITAPGEGDPQCAAISKYHNLSVITDDTDILAFGGSRIWKDFSLMGKTTHELNKQNILEQMYLKANKIRRENLQEPIDDFNHQHFIDYCIMLGTDYTPYNCKFKISGTNAIQLFKLFVINDLNVEKMCEYITSQQTSVKVSSNFIQNWKQTKEKYMNTSVIHPNCIDIKMQKPSVDELITFLCDKNGLDRSFITGKVISLEEKYKLFNDVYSGNLSSDENKFASFTSYRVKHSKQKLERLKCLIDKSINFHYITKIESISRDYRTSPIF